MTPRRAAPRVGCEDGGRPPVTAHRRALLDPTTPGRPVVIEPEAGWPRIDFRELWAYRGLALFLVWRDLKVRYAQTVFGVSWAVLQPLLTMVVFSTVFGRFARIPSEGVPYPVFSLAAVVPWTYFANALGNAGNSLVSNTHLVSKVYFPRLVIPLAPVLAALVDLAIALVILLLVMLWYRILPEPAALFVVPLLVLILVMACAGAGAALASINIQFRDVRHAVPFLLQLWMYASPVVYPLKLVPQAYRPLYDLNPLVGVITGFRAVLLHTAPIPWDLIGRAFVVSVVMLVGGGMLFRRRERIFADVA